LSNQYAFLAIVAHYITNEGKLGMFLVACICAQSMIPLIDELLIDFRKLSGEHSGENMAQAVWGTLTQYNLVGRVSLLIALAYHY
jgi:hypothetical protein